MASVERERLSFIHQHVSHAGGGKLIAVARAFEATGLPLSRDDSLSRKKTRLSQFILSRTDEEFAKGKRKFADAFVEHAEKERQEVLRERRDRSPARERVSRHRWSPAWERGRSPSPERRPSSRFRDQSPSRSSSAYFRYERPSRAMPPRPRRLPTPVEPEPAPAVGAGPATPAAVQNEAEAAESVQTKALRLAEEWQMFMRMAQGAMEEMTGLQLPGMAVSVRPAGEQADLPRSSESQ